MNIKQVQIIDLEEVSDAQFAPFGRIWGREAGEPEEVLENLKYYACNVDPATSNEMEEAGVLVCNEKGRDIRYFERHPETAESFIPIEGECIFVMAPGNIDEAKPEADKIKAFYLNGSLGVILPAGNWHWPPIPIGKRVKLLLIRKGTNSDPCDIVELKEMGLDGIRVTL
jgi:ureidoglycolate lyase